MCNQYRVCASVMSISEFPHLRSLEELSALAATARAEDLKNCGVCLIRKSFSFLALSALVVIAWRGVMSLL